MSTNHRHRPLFFLGNRAERIRPQDQYTKCAVAPGGCFFLENHWKHMSDILLMVQKSGVHQLRLVGYPIICMGLYIPSGCLGCLPLTV